jgi:hypothetical protein
MQKMWRSADRFPVEAFFSFSWSHEGISSSRVSIFTSNCCFRPLQNLWWMLVTWWMKIMWIGDFSGLEEAFSGHVHSTRHLTEIHYKTTHLLPQRGEGFVLDSSSMDLTVVNWDQREHRKARWLDLAAPWQSHLASSADIITHNLRQKRKEGGGQLQAGDNAWWCWKASGGPRAYGTEVAVAARTSRRGSGDIITHLLLLFHREGGGRLRKEKDAGNRDALGRSRARGGSEAGVAADRDVGQSGRGHTLLFIAPDWDLLAAIVVV